MRKRQARLYVMFWKSGCAIVRFRMRGFVDLLACQDRVWANVKCEAPCPPAVASSLLLKCSYRSDREWPGIDL